ncbi:hypothetical protein QAD02_008408 [Eretmocerus hayati]|uniref:Uncharacterized protein n=1 Tax=Eretmocerus hayati TaxID=131215 RepID=A0ACC2N7S9_9HYME|nr:hypothetical protein QAD02_008408 [Eretmocerus hayati]
MSETIDISEGTHVGLTRVEAPKVPNRDQTPDTDSAHREMIHSQDRTTTSHTPTTSRVTMDASSYSFLNNLEQRTAALANSDRVLRNHVQKATHVVKILPDFNGQDMSVEQFIRENKNAERFVDPSDKDFLLEMIEAKVMENARTHIRRRIPENFDEFVKLLKRAFSSTQNLP